MVNQQNEGATGSATPAVRWRRVPPLRVPIRRRVPPRRLTSAPAILLGLFLLLNVSGGVLLCLPFAAADGVRASPQVAFFTAISASTVTGLTQVDTQTFWSPFGQAVLFVLMLVGGLEFMTAATVLVFFGRRTTVLEEEVYRDTVGSGHTSSVAKVARNIVLAFMLGYFIGAALIFYQMRSLPDMSLAQAAWQSLFLSVSAFNNAGLSILPNAASGNNLDTLGAYPYFAGVITPMIILGALGWPLMVDMRRNWRPGLGRGRLSGLYLFNFSRFTLDTKLVLILTLGLYALSAAAFLFAEWNGVLAGHSLIGKAGSSIFHGASGRTAGFAALDWSGVRDFTLLVYGGLMFIGGSTASVAGGIKVNTVAVLLAAARSAALRHPRTEVFRREIGATLVARALMIALIAVAYLGVVVPILTYTDPHLNFEKLMFEAVSAFGTNGMSTGVSRDLSLAGAIIFMVTMLAGRIGPLTLVMLLAPREEASYRYPEEPVRIG